jgi:GxxExxY protein
MRPHLIEGARVHSIVGAFFAVYNYFGYGLAEAVYAGGLECELGDRGHHVAREYVVDVRYKGRHAAWQRLDMVVDSKIIVEINATEKAPPFAARQLLSYLRATSFEVGVLLHFGPETRFDRYVDSPKTVRLDTPESG